MTKQIIQYRALNKADYSQVAQLINKTWEYDQTASNWNAKQMAYCFLFSTLSKYTFSKVAVQNDNVVGILVGNSYQDDPPSFVFKLKLFWRLFLLFLTNEGREAIQSMRRNDLVNKALYKRTNQNFGGELLLFTVDSSVQGQGVGTTLYHSYLDYLNEQAVQTFYLYTDTSCTYSFYDNKHLKRAAVITRKMPFYKTNMTFFLYTGKIA